LQIYVQSSQKALHKKAKKIPISQIMHIFNLKMHHFYLIMKNKMSFCENDFPQPIKIRKHKNKLFFFIFEGRKLWKKA